jgi:hypothetical protein
LANIFKESPAACRASDPTRQCGLVTNSPAELIWFVQSYKDFKKCRSRGYAKITFANGFSPYSKAMVTAQKEYWRGALFRKRIGLTPPIFAQAEESPPNKATTNPFLTAGHPEEWITDWRNKTAT